MKFTEPKIGDLVLATRWKDGDPHDPWCIGFYKRKINSFFYKGDEYLIVEGTDIFIGKCYMWTRIKKISKERGEFILNNQENIRQSGYSMWHFARCKIS